MEVIINGEVYVKFQDSKTMLVLPETIEQAEWMQKIGYRYISENAPDRLTDLAREIIESKKSIVELAETLSFYANRKHMGWTPENGEQAREVLTQYKYVIQKAREA